MSENPFWDLVQGKDIGCNVLYKDTEIIVFDDKYGVSGKLLFEIIDYYERELSIIISSNLIIILLN